jgi:hypothetical protein
MKNIFMFFLLVSLMVSCTTTRKVSEQTVTNNTLTSVEQDGSSYENAIVIKKSTERAGVDAEYAWLSQHYPGYKSKGQSLNFHHDKPYDIIKILTNQGEEKSIYFDISKFYGKF